MAGPGRIGGLLLGRRGPAAPLPSGERAWRSRAGKEPERGAEGRGDGGGGDRSRSHGRGIFSGPFPPPRSQAKTPASVLVVPRPGERIPRCGKCPAAGRGTGDRGLCPVCGRIGVREVEVSPPASRSLAGPGPFQSRKASCRDNHRPPLPSFLPKTLRLEPPPPWGVGPGKGQKRPEEAEGTPVFLFPRPFSLLSLMASPRESCFLPAVSAVILSKNPVQ